MRAPDRALRALLVGVAVGVTAACSGPGAEPAPSATSSLASPSLSSPARPSRAAAVRELQAFLDSWRTDGVVVASRTYLAPDQQVTDSADALVKNGMGDVAKNYTK